MHLHILCRWDPHFQARRDLTVITFLRREVLIWAIYYNIIQHAIIYYNRLYLNTNMKFVTCSNDPVIVM